MDRKDIVAAMSTIQGQSTSNASSISQRAATVALNGDQACVGEMNKAFKERHDFVVAGLNAIPGISCLPGAGTFYAFAERRGRHALARHSRTTTSLPNTLLAQAGVAVVPGSGFGAPGPHAHLVCLQHGDPQGGVEPHPTRRFSPGSQARLGKQVHLHPCYVLDWALIS